MTAASKPWSAIATTGAAVCENHERYGPAHPRQQIERGRAVERAARRERVRLRDEEQAADDERRDGRNLQDHEDALHVAARAHAEAVDDGEERERHGGHG